MTTATASAVRQGAAPVKVAGILTVVGAVLGFVGAIVLVVVPPVPGSEGTFAFPLSPAGHAAAQVTFAVNHVLIGLGLLAVTLAPALRSRVARAGGWVAVAGMALLTGVEIAVAFLGSAPYPSDDLVLIDTLYPVGSLLIGVGLVVLGVGIVRIPSLRGWQRWIVLATGAALFLIVTPGLMLGFVAGRLALAVWMLFWAALGVALAQTAPRKALGY